MKIFSYSVSRGEKICSCKDEGETTRNGTESGLNVSNESGRKGNLYLFHIAGNSCLFRSLQFNPKIYPFRAISSPTCK